MRRKMGEELLDLTGRLVLLSPSHIQVDQPQGSQISREALWVSVLDSLEHFLVKRLGDQCRDIRADFVRLFIWTQRDLVKPGLNGTGGIFLLEIELAAQMHGFPLGDVVLRQAA